MDRGETTAGEGTIGYIGHAIEQYEQDRIIRPRARYVGSEVHTDLHVVVGEEITVIEGHQIGDHVAQRIREFSPDVVDVLVHIDPYDDRDLRQRPARPN